MPDGCMLFSPCIDAFEHKVMNRTSFMLKTKSMTTTLLLIALAVLVPTNAQFVPFNFSNWTIPFPQNLSCSPPPPSNHSFSSAVSGLTWCQYENPFILSDFLSRNSTDLTTRGTDSNRDFRLNIYCDGLPVDNFSTWDNTAPGANYQSCRAIQSMQAGSAGMLNVTTGEAFVMINYIMFIDLDGQLLFVYFNNNSMANSMQLQGMTNINNFDVSNIQYVSEYQDPHTGVTSQRIVQDVVLFVTNASSAGMIGVSGKTGELSDPCLLFSYGDFNANILDIQLLSAEFFPKTANSTGDIISLGWAASSNLSKMLSLVYKEAVPSWAYAVNYYEFNAVPSNQDLIADYIRTCPQKTPMDIQLWWQIYSYSALKFSTLHNRVSNMSFLLAYSEQGVVFYRLEYAGPHQTDNASGIPKTMYNRSLFVIDWCDTRYVDVPNVALKDDNFQNVSRAKNSIFCVPNNETVIDAVEMISPDTFTGIGTYNMDVWLIIALHNKTNSYLYVMSLTELTYIDPETSTYDNPLGLPPTYGTASFPCDFDTQVYYQDPKTGHIKCDVRITATYVLPRATPVTSLVTRVISLRSSRTTGNHSMDNDMGDTAGDHSLIFAAQGSSVSVFAMYSGFVNTSAPFGMIFQFYNEIGFLGNVTNMYVSMNGMHLLTSVTRNAWELKAQTRYVDICDALQKNPDDKFLGPGFKDACAEMPPQEVNINAFTQYSSYCSFNMYCPSLDQWVVSVPQDHYYADRPAVAKVCPVGYFCVAGQKVECPQGFYCDEEGLASPKRCPMPVNSNSTCAQPGLTAPMACPHGTVCSLPHIPGLPAPPGFEVPSPPQQRNDFAECPDGFWCPLGAQAEIPNTTFTNTTFECPANTYCCSTSVVDPVVCECSPIAPGSTTLGIITANGSQLLCDGHTLYCPAGSTDVNLCPAGFYCTMPNESNACIPTQYCAPGTFAPVLCPAGTYCPSPAESIACPSGHYCPEGSVLALECNFLTVCPAGSTAQSRSLLVVFVLFAVVAGVTIGFFVFTRYERRKQEEAAAVAILSREGRDYLAQGDGDDDDYLKDENNDEENNLKQPIVSAGAPMSVPTSRFQTPNIRFDGMGLRLEVGEAKGKVVLDNVTGTIPAGSFVAVMGPSGSGKSTFMHTLAGKAFYGTRMGHVYLNDDEVDLNQFSKIVGFVKQDDIMLREMTVAETLLFNARMRYDPLSVDSPEGIANAMLTALDLNHVRGTNIGDEKKRGISGGQRKRVNIGMELVALPSILFLDEPTSGLDSSSSMSVCSALRDMANVGITVIAVIHQPRYEIFNMFHKVLLLAKGGKLVYYGAPNDALNYFENHIGIKCPQHVNPPDFFMDVISGETNSLGLSIDDMVKKWNEYQGAHLQSDDGDASETSSKRRSSMMLSNDGKDSLIPGLKLAEQAKQKEIAGFFSQLRLFTGRSMVQLSRDMIWFFTDLILVFVSGFFLGLVFSDSEYQPPLPAQIVNRSIAAFGPSPPPMLAEFFARPVDDPIISEASLTCMAIGMTGVTAALRVFGNEQIVYWREASAGMSTAAYFLSKNITHILFIVLSPLLYLAPFLTFVSARASFMAYYRVLVVLQFTTTGLGYLVSIVIPGGLAQLAGVVMVLVFAMFGGSRPTLVEIKKMFILLQAMPFLSYIRWAQEALYLEEITVWNQIEGVNINPSLQLFDYALSDYQMCMLLTIVFGVVFRLLALIAMYVMHRDQKH